MNPRLLTPTSAAACLTLAPATVALAQNAWSRFESGLDGWTLEGPGALTWIPTGGIADGYLRIERTGTGELFLVPPPEFLGNWLSSSPPGLVSSRFTMGLLPDRNPDRTPVELIVSGPLGQASTPVLSFSQLHAGEWAAISLHPFPIEPLANVASLRIRVGAAAGLPIGEVIGIDMVQLQTCGANCDRSTTPPVLNVNDFVCFQRRWTERDPWAEFDGYSQWIVSDYIAFLNRYAAGCSGP